MTRSRTEEMEHFVWSVLTPADWRKERHLDWRYAARELKKLAAARRDADKQ